MNMFPPQPPLPGDLPMTLFPQSSRYYGMELRKHTFIDGRVVSYLPRRFIPPADRFHVLEEHAVVAGERLDHLAAQYIGDSEQFWRLADANDALNPFELTATPNRQLKITLPEGVPGFSAPE